MQSEYYLNTKDIKSKMEKEEKEIMPPTWDIARVRAELTTAFEENSEQKLLSVLKDNSFLFYELVSHKYGIQPVFREINFGGKLRCDFAWLNDNSDGPEWVLVEVEKPKMKLFTQKNEPTSELNHAIEQVKSWERYFDEYPFEKKCIFGAVARFRFILIVGDKESWKTDFASKWRIHNNKKTKIEIRTSYVFLRALKVLEQHPEEFWSFAEHPKTMPPSELEKYWRSYGYIGQWRKIID